MTRVSAIATVLNEASSVGTLLDSLAAQGRAEFEIVIVDGGSHDATPAILREYAARDQRIRVIEAPGTNIAAGRNRAIAAASGDIIVATDAGVRLPGDWLDLLTRPLIDDPTIDVVGGFFASAPTTVFEFALGCSTLPRVEEIDPATFNPSSRSVAFRRSAWEAAGRYPEWLDFCEDLWFDLRLRHERLKIAFEPRASVAFRPRSSLAAFGRQYFRYARGDGKAGILLGRHLARYSAYGVLAIALASAEPGLLALSVVGALTYCVHPWRRIAATREQHEWMGPWDLVVATAWVPVIRVVGDLAKMAGFPVGVAWRLRHPFPSRQGGRRGEA